jgi:hypothetical protein
MYLFWPMFLFRPPSHGMRSRRESPPSPSVRKGERRLAVLVEATFLLSAPHRPRAHVLLAAFAFAFALAVTKPHRRHSLVPPSPRQSPPPKPYLCLNPIIDPFPRRHGRGPERRSRSQRPPPLADERSAPNPDTVTAPAPHGPRLPVPTPLCTVGVPPTDGAPAAPPGVQLLLLGLQQLSEPTDARARGGRRIASRSLGT